MSAPSRGVRKGPWRCFQCGELFTDPVEASQHFSNGHEMPGCVDPLAKDEKARLVELRDARQVAREALAAEEAADEDRALLASYRSEIGRLFGKVGGVLASTPHQAWLRLDYEIGRALAAEAEVERLRGLVEEAYREGYAVVLDGDYTLDEFWAASDARAALAREEGT